MVTKSFSIQFDEYDCLDDLNTQDKNLLYKAIEATNSSYAPYSNFNVGAALLLDNNEIITASNQENIAYPSGLCAERVAIFYANSKFPTSKIITIAIVASVNGSICDMPTYPCGACRQVMAEAESRSSEKIKYIIGGKKRVQIMYGTESLLPFIFDSLPK